MTLIGYGDKSHCIPDFVRTHKTLIVGNIVLIIVIGTLGNLLTLFAFPYAMFYYNKRFPQLYSTTTILLLHLALCDFFYCIFGLTVQADIYLNGYLNASENLCFWNAWTRNMVAYVDFFTMAAIALIRCITIVCCEAKVKRFLNYLSVKVTMFCCGFLWLFTFIIISPTTFEAEGFGHFGYDPEHGRCEINQCQQIDAGLSPSGFYFLSASTIPCPVIIACYLVVGVYIRIQTNRLHGLNSEIATTRINATLFSLALAYFMFTVPLLPVELGLLDIHLSTEVSSYYTVCIFSWYWWIYASNFMVYIATTADFRTIYRLFLRDTSLKFGATNLAKKIYDL